MMGCGHLKLNRVCSDCMRAQMSEVCPCGCGFALVVEWMPRLGMLGHYWAQPVVNQAERKVP